MKIGVLKPNDSRDLRSTIHPETIGKLSNIEGLNISFEHGAGAGMSISDDVFVALGANPQTRLEIIQQSDFIFIQDVLSNEELSSLKSGTTLIGIVSPFANKEFIQGCANKEINLVSMEFVPRITRAQKMDVLSSQANLAGYVAVLSASSHFHSALPMMMTAAGTLKPAKVFIIGVGVAGLQAIATAKRLGAKVEAFDTRPVVEEQVQSLGAKFVKIDLGDTGQTDQGYAKELTEEQLAKQRELQAKVCARSDIVITTAQLFGRPAPRLIDENTIEHMMPGSVIFDMAVESGGNVAGSVVDEVVIKNGVKIMGQSHLPSKVPNHASLALSNNFINLFLEFYDQESQSFNFNLEDEILDSSMLVYNGEIRNEAFK